MRTPTALLASLLTLTLLGCGVSTTTVSGPVRRVVGPPPAPATTPVVVRESPPPPTETPRTPFPTVISESLNNEMGVDVIERHALPLVELTLLVHSGQASDGDHPGAAAVTSLLLEAGGAGPWSSQQLRERVDALGSSLSITPGRNAITLSLAVSRDHVDEGLRILAALVRQPRFSPEEFGKLRVRERERVSSLFRTSGTAVARYVLNRELYSQPLGVHPYASLEALPSELDRLTLPSCRAFHRRHFTPANLRLIAVGDITPTEATSLARRYFGTWAGGAPPSEGVGLPIAPTSLRILVVDRPGSTQSDIVVGLLGPRRQEREFSSVLTMQQIVGGGVAGRLFLDLREKRSLAYSTSTSMMEVEEGPSTILLTAGTQTAKTREAVAALLEHVELAATGQLSPGELETAQNYLVHGMPMRWETVGSLAQQLALLRTLGLSERHFDELRDEIAETSPQSLALAREFYARSRAVVVVAGDAALVQDDLRALGPVEILDPNTEFTIQKRLEATEAPTARTQRPQP
jgi:zinc protease